jgi:hypothetical protein
MELKQLRGASLNSGAEAAALQALRAGRMISKIAQRPIGARRGWRRQTAG